MFIYRITNSINGKIYIGYDSGSIEEGARWKQHIGYGSGAWKLTDSLKKNALYKAMKKYGTENFYYDVIEEIYNIEVLREREIFWITHYGSFINGYNLTKGGDGGTTYEDLLPHQKIARNEKIKKTVRKYWENISQEDRSKKSLKTSEVQRSRVAKMSKEEKVNMTSHLPDTYKKWWDDLSIEDKEQHSKKLSESIDPKKRSLQTSRMWENMTEEKRKVMSDKISARQQSRSVEEKSEISQKIRESRKCYFESRSLERIEQDREMQRKKAKSYWENATPEQIAQRSEKARLTRLRKKGELL